METPGKAGFWQQRTGWMQLRQLLFLEPLPGGSRWAAAFGSLLLFAFVLQVITGIMLSMNYAPSAQTAWPSVNAIQEDGGFGAFIRGLHHWGSSAMVILLLVHLVQVFVWGAYKRPRELTWMVGVLLLVCTLGLTFTGYLLPWDQKAYWATKVGLAMASTVPAIGDDLRQLLQGGPELGNLTLTRFFTLHGFILPGALILLVTVHLYLFRLHGVTPPWWESAARLKAQEEPFWPKQALKDGLLALLFLVALGLWAYCNPAPLEGQADPSQPYDARPEWYFMFLFLLLRYFQGPFEIVGTFILPTLFFLILFFWPFLDRNRECDPRRRPVAMSLLGAGVAGLLGLTIYAIATDVRMQEPEIAKTPAAATERAGLIQRADVAKIFNSNCAACHGVDGTGEQIRPGMPTIPDFSTMAWQLSQTELEIVHRIQEGNEPLMPAYRDKLTHQQILALAIYVRAFRPIETAAGKSAVPPAEVKAQMPASQVYVTWCMGCHDANGSGASMRKIAMPDIPDFRDAKWWQQLDIEERCKKAILKGTGPGKFMVAQEDKLGATDVGEMVKYLKKFQDGKQVVEVKPPRIIPPGPVDPVVIAKDPLHKPPGPSPDTAARLRAAAALYRQYCLICHGKDGKGSDMKASMPTIADFSSRTWFESSTNAQLATSILNGKGTLMPAFGGERVSQDQARDLVAYLRAFGPPGTQPAEQPVGDFEKQFRDLQRQWDELQKQLQDLTRPPGKAMLQPKQRPGHFDPLMPVGPLALLSPCLLSAPSR
jgi:quinol-cytochrome oxidoreductase complex cytochrome b subunit